jgi:hypothetical protein
VNERYTFFDKAKTSVDDIEVRDKTSHALPGGAGYVDNKFASDMLASFEDQPRSKNTEVYDTWEDHVLYKGNKFGQRYMSLGEAEQTVDTFGKFWDKFNDSSLKKSLLNYFGGDTAKAAQTVMDWVEYHADPSKPPSQMGQDLIDAMEKIEKEGIKLPTQGTGTKFNQSNDPGKMIAKQMRVRELLPRVRRKYEFAAIKSFTYEPCFYPEDEANIRNMRSLEELMKVPKAQLGDEDDIFFHKVAGRLFPVLEFQRAIPIPKTFTILIDISGSMQGEMSDGYTRAEFAQATGVALAEQAEAGGNSCEVVYFDTQCHPPITGSPQEIQEQLLNQSFGGGGTNFENAFRGVDKRDTAAVVLVTDGESGFTKPPKAPLHTVLVHEGYKHNPEAMDEHIKHLRNCSVRFSVVG